MAEGKSHQDITAAEDKSIGFEYQYYYFLYLILGLNPGETIGLEIKDDIHIDFPDKKQTLMQLKHSVQTNAEGEVINLRESDIDLWKTIYNWIKVINDTTEGRIDLESQIEYINKTDFILISNKANNTKNKLLVNIKNYREGKLNIDEFIEYLREKNSKGEVEKKKDGSKENNKLYLYISEILNQEKDWLEKFLSKISFNLNEDDLIDKIKLMIKSKFVPEISIEDIFSSLDSNIRRDNYIAIKKGDRLTYSFDDLYEKYTRCFFIGRTSRRIIRKDKPIINGNPEEQIFIKQLLDLEVFSVTDKDYLNQIIKRTNAKLYTFNNLEQWKQDGELLSLEKEKYDEETKYEWEATFNKTYSKLRRNLREKDYQIEENKLIDLGNDCLDEILLKKLSFDETALDLEMSNGQFYLLSDKPSIGWRFDWDERYKK